MGLGWVSRVQRPEEVRLRAGLIIHNWGTGLPFLGSNRIGSTQNHLPSGKTRSRHSWSYQVPTNRWLWVKTRIQCMTYLGGCFIAWCCSLQVFNPDQCLSLESGTPGDPSSRHVPASEHVKTARPSARRESQSSCVPGRAAQCAWFQNLGFLHRHQCAELGTVVLTRRRRL